MATWFLANAENGTDGAAVTPASSGFDYVTAGASPATPARYSEAQAIKGTRAFLLSSDSYSELKKDLGGRTHWRVRLYVRRVSGALTAHYMLGKGNGSTVDQLQVRTDGKLYIRNNFTAPASAISSRVFAVGETWRIELEYISDLNTKSMTVRVWYGTNLDGENPNETLTNPAAGGSTEWGTGPDASTGGVFAVDSIAFSDGEALGPDVPTSELALSVSGGGDVAAGSSQRIAATASGGSGSRTVTIQRLSGPDRTLARTGDAWDLVMPRTSGGVVLAYRVTVQDGAGATLSRDVTFTVAADPDVVDSGNPGDDLSWLPLEVRQNYQAVHILIEGGGTGTGGGGSSSSAFGTAPLGSSSFGGSA